MHIKKVSGESPYCDMKMGCTLIDDTDPRRKVVQCISTEKYYVISKVNGAAYPLTDPLDLQSSPATKTH